MLRTASRQASSRGKATPRIPTICIVGPQAADSPVGRSVGEQGGVRVRLVANADEALRHSRTERVDLWAVNTELTGLSGYELCAMLKAQSPSAAVCLVAKEYTEEAERRAWSARATMFCCVATLDEHVGSVTALL